MVPVLNCGVAKAIISNFVFPTCACAAGFNNDNNMNRLVAVGGSLVLWISYYGLT